MHDWSDDAVVKILSHVRASATPETKLVVVDQVVPYASKSLEVDAIPGAAKPPTPAALLPNLGAASATVYWSDLHVCHGNMGEINCSLLTKQMYALLNGKERTMGGFVDVFEKSGWKIVEVHHVPGSLFSHVVGVPA